MKRLASLVTFLVVLVGSLIAASAPAFATDFTVDSTLDAPDAAPGDARCASATGACTLRAAVMELNALNKPSNNLRIPSGTYTLTVAGAGEDQGATGDLDIRVSMNISATSGTPIIQGGSGFGDRIFDIPAGTSPAIYMVGFLIQQGTAPAGESGGGIRYLGGSSFILQNTTIVTNSASSGSGGGMYVAGPVGSTFTVNGLAGLTLRGNTAGVNGGGIDVEGGTVADIKTLTATSNSAFSGGGVSSFLEPGSSGALTLHFSTITGNSTASGGGGGGLAVARTFLSHLTISGNAAAYGGGVKVVGAAAPTTVGGRLSVIDNVATEDGGGLYFAGCGGSCTVTDLEVDTNTATKNGSGIYVSGGLTLAATTLYRNKTLGSGSAGGAFYHGGPAGQPLTVTNATLTENSGGPASSGFVLASSSTDVLLNDTIAGNTGGAVNAIAVQGTAPQLKNVAIGINTPNCSGPIISLGHNLEGGNTCNFNQAGDIINTDPLLSPWADTGGFTKTMRPSVCCSPVLDAGDLNGCALVDQRVVTRPLDSNNDGIPGCEIGAYEMSQYTRNSDLQVVMSASATLVPQGTNVTYTMAVANTAGDPLDATNVTLVDDLPSGVAFVSCSATSGGVCGGTGNHRTVLWSAFPLGNSATVTLVAQVLPQTATSSRIVNPVRISAENPDLWSWDNYSTVTTFLGTLPVGSADRVRRASGGGPAPGALP